MIGYGTSGTTHDFFCYNAAGQVWNGSAFVTWADGDYASYRVTATEVGTTGRFTGTAPSGTETYELRERGASVAASYVVWTDDQKLKDDAATAVSQTSDIAAEVWDAPYASHVTTGTFGQATVEIGADVTALQSSVGTVSSTVLASRKLLEADRISVLIAGVYYERTLERGTGTQLIPDKKIKQTDGATDLVNPITQRYGGAVEE